MTKGYGEAAWSSIRLQRSQRRRITSGLQGLSESLRVSHAYLPNRTSQLTLFVSGLLSTVNVLLVVGNERLQVEMSKLMSTNKTVTVIRVPKNSGVSILRGSNCTHQVADFPS